MPPRSRRIAAKEGAGGLVVGLAAVDGRHGRAGGPGGAGLGAGACRTRRALPVALWDERLSSAAVNRFLIDDADLSRRKRAEVVDRMAAAYLLQAALDASRRRLDPPSGLR